MLWWVDDGEQFAVACDASPRLRDNVRTVYKWIPETRLRGQRPVQTGDSEFAAARLPPGDNEVAATGSMSTPAREVLSVAPDDPDGVAESAARARKAGRIRTTEATATSSSASSRRRRRCWMADEERVAKAPIRDEKRLEVPLQRVYRWQSALRCCVE